ncbi:hypothetical protein PR048_000287 [Dryococelus australis]|uniref:Uncharacterized protein n=1 Tax=Dryococelus australis TaxID=614101 RepID=A0ABQ9IE71_9NEOP|nr:hypothetical protein PR048_000287 [Dryococelus australis]
MTDVRETDDCGRKKGILQWKLDEGAKFPSTLHLITRESGNFADSLSDKLDSTVLCAFEHKNLQISFSRATLERSLQSVKACLNSTVVCAYMAICTAHWLSAVTVEGDYWASVLKEVAVTFLLCGHAHTLIDSARFWERASCSDWPLHAEGDSPLEETRRTREFDDVYAIIHSHMYNIAAIDCTLALCCQSGKLDSTVLYTLEQQMFVHWLLPQRVASVSTHLAVWHLLLVSLQVCYWLRVVQGGKRVWRVRLEFAMSAALFHISVLNHSAVEYFRVPGRAGAKSLVSVPVFDHRSVRAGQGAQLGSLAESPGRGFTVGAREGGQIRCVGEEGPCTSARRVVHMCLPPFTTNPGVLDSNRTHVFHVGQECDLCSRAGSPSNIGPVGHVNVDQARCMRLFGEGVPLRVSRTADSIREISHVTWGGGGNGQPFSHLYEIEIFMEVVRTIFDKDHVARVKHRRNAREGEMGDSQENPLTSGIVRHDSRMRKSNPVLLGMFWTNRKPLTTGWPNHVQLRRKGKCVITAAEANDQLAQTQIYIGRRGVALANSLGQQPMDKHLMLECTQDCGVWLSVHLICEPFHEMTFPLDIRALKVSRVYSTETPSGNRAGRCRWSEGFLGDLPFPPSPSFRGHSTLTSIALIGSQDLAVKSHPNLFTRSLKRTLLKIAPLVATSTRSPANRESFETRISQPGSTAASIASRRQSENGSAHIKGTATPAYYETIFCKLQPQLFVQLLPPYSLGKGVTLRQGSSQWRNDAGSSIYSAVNFNLTRKNNANFAGEVSTGRCWNARAGETGDPRENPLTNGIVQYDSHMRKYPERTWMRPLVHTVFDTSWRTEGQSLPSTLTADNQCAADIGIFVQQELRNGMAVVTFMWEFPLFNWLRESLGTNLVSDWLLRGCGRCSVLTCYLNVYCVHCAYLNSSQGAAVAGRLACSPPTKANQVRTPAGSADDAVGRRFFSGISRSPHSLILALLQLHGNASVGETGYPREYPLTSGIDRHEIPTCDNPGATPGGIEPGSPSRMYKYADINCTLVVCCHGGRKLLGKRSQGGVSYRLRRTEPKRTIHSSDDQDTTLFPYDPFKVPSHISEVLLKLYFQDIPPPHAKFDSKRVKKPQIDIVMCYWPSPLPLNISARLSEGVCEDSGIGEPSRSGQRDFSSCDGPPLSILEFGEFLRPRAPAAGSEVCGLRTLVQRRVRLAGLVYRTGCDKIDVKHVYTEVDFAIGSQFIRHALDNSEPISD